MGQQAYANLTLTGTATAAITANRFVSPVIAQTAAAGNSLGVARSGAAIGALVPIDAGGTTIVEAGAAIAAGALVESDASGRAVTRSAGAILGRMAPGEVASGAGALVEIILIPN